MSDCFSAVGAAEKSPVRCRISLARMLIDEFVTPFIHCRSRSLASRSANTNTADTRRRRRRMKRRETCCQLRAQRQTLANARRNSLQSPDNTERRKWQDEKIDRHDDRTCGSDRLVLHESLPADDDVIVFNASKNSTMWDDTNCAVQRKKKERKKTSRNGTNNECCKSLVRRRRRRGDVSNKGS